MFSGGSILVEVINDQKETLFFLKQEPDRINGGNNRLIDVNVNYHELLSEGNNVDHTLIKDIDAVIFRELEEYSYEITKFILNRYSGIKIYFLDENAKFFFDRDKVIVCSSLYDIPALDMKRVLYILSEWNRYEGLFSGRIYTSIQLMSSLCWACSVKILGNLNADKTILLIIPQYGEGCGLAYIIRAVTVLEKMAYERGWIPVVSLSGNNLYYIDDLKDNMWEQYFEQPSNITVSEALRSRNVIDLFGNHFTAASIYQNPMFDTLWQRTDLHANAEFKWEIREELENKTNKIFVNIQGKILGAFIRGTDSYGVASDKMETLCMIKECKEIMKSKGYSYIFLATEDLNYFIAFKEAFGDKLLCIEQKRVVKENDDDRSIGELLEIQTGEKAEFGKKYLWITYALSKCDALVYNIPSGGFYLANKWRKDPFEFVTRLDMKSSELSILIEISQLLNKNTKVVIYGAGIVGSKIIRFFNIAGRKNIVFCDKKAEGREYYYEDFYVIAPTKLVNEYRKLRFPIIIASELYADEIKEYLVNNTIRYEDILIYKDEEKIIK